VLEFKTIVQVTQTL